MMMQDHQKGNKSGLLKRQKRKEKKRLSIPIVREKRKKKTPRVLRQSLVDSSR